MNRALLKQKFKGARTRRGLIATKSAQLNHRSGLQFDRSAFFYFLSPDDLFDEFNNCALDISFSDFRKGI